MTASIAVPMFPLGTPVLPGMAIPLQVFEPRYVSLVRDLLATDARPLEFGTVMIERGWEVGGGDQRANVGVMVQMLDVRIADDGRYHLSAVGTDRIRVQQWLADDPYPRAEVTAWPDEVDPPDDLSERVGSLRHALAELTALAREIDHPIAARLDELPPAAVPPSNPVALYELALRAPIGAADRFKVLAAPDARRRCDVLAEAIDDAMALLRFGRT